MHLELIQEILQYLHSGLRWLLVGVAVFTIVYLAIRLFSSRRYDELSARLMVAVSALTVGEWFIGLLIMLLPITIDQVNGVHYLAHVFFMTLAVIAGCFHFFLRRRPLHARQLYRWHLALLIVVCILVALGVLVLPPDLRWRFYPAIRL